MLEVRKLSMVYPDGTEALTDVSFTVKPHEFLIVIGLSGSGKSTLLRCINRLVKPTSGDVLFEGESTTNADETQLRSIRRNIGMVFQQFNLVKRSKVLTNTISGRLGYASSFQSAIGRFSKDDKRIARAALERVGMADLAGKLARELSGGQQQRVGIARALAQEPKLILADEPVASLDPVLAHTILNYLEELNKNEGITIICSLHYLDLVQRYATRVIGLKDGRVVYEGDRDEIRKMTDVQFKQIYGEEAERVSAASIGDDE